MFQDGLEKQKEEVLSFLMIGQSNMAGRGEIGDVPPIENPNCLMLRMGRWQLMSEPINPDRPIFTKKTHSGIGLAASFADSLAKASGKKIGLIPCADGGTKIQEWLPGEILYDHALFQAKLALRSSRLGGILWHQGESDCTTEEGLEAYESRFIPMITQLRRELGAENLPLLIGEISEHITERWGVEDRAPKMNVTFHEIAKKLPFCAVVSSKDLPLKPDGIHFNAAACRIFGERYFQAYRRIVKG